MNELKESPKDPKVLLTNENKGFGGAETHTLTLAGALTRTHTLEALICRKTSWLAAHAGSVTCFPVAFRNEVDMLSVYAIYRKIKVSQANVLHCIGHRDLVASALARQLPGAPKTVLLKAEHSYPDTDLSPLFRWAYGQCDAITSVSAALAKSVREALSPGAHIRTPVVSNGIDIPFTVSQRPNPENRTLRIGVLSPLRPGKGVEDFLEAATRLRTQLERRVEFVIAGDGELRESLERRAHSLDLEVQFTGHVEDPVTFLHDLDLSVVPSLQETFSLVSLESLCCGRPLLAADSQGVIELTVDSPAALYPKGDVTALTEALAAFCLAPETALKKAFDFAPQAQQKFSSEQMAAQYCSLYNSLLEEKNQ